MSFDEAARRYLDQLHRELTAAQSAGYHTAELSYRPFLDSFLREIASAIDPRIFVIFEPRKQASSGRPDWRMHDSASLGLYGYVEAKPPDLSKRLNADDHKDQIAKYRALGGKLILSDGLDFIFVDHERETYLCIPIVDKPISLGRLRRAVLNVELERHLRDFFRSASSRRCTEDQIIKDVAIRALRLSEEIGLLADAPQGSGMTAEENAAIAALQELREILARHHDPVLRDSKKAFADFVAQVLIFGLLYAHRIIRNQGGSPTELYGKIHTFWTGDLYQGYASRLRPFQELARLFGTSLDTPGALGTWYDDCRRMLAHVQLDQTQVSSPDFHILYENFLKVYDPAARFDYGAFYTPTELTSFCVKLTLSITQQFLPGRSLYEPNNKLIDPCCGTGTFIEQLIKNMDVSDVGARIIGFEILPAPYALAHFRLTMLGSAAYPDKISIVLTDTLSDLLEQPAPVGTAHPMAIEQTIARDLSRPPLTLVIGNPPSSDSSRRRDVPNQSIIRRLVDDWRPPIQQRRERQNTQKQLTNEFVKFLRWACTRLSATEPGMVMFILPSSFAEHPSYRFARKWLSEFFHRIWILDLDADARTGVRTDSLFNTLQGRLLFVGLREPSGHLETPNQSFYATISDRTKEGKRAFLTGTSSNAVSLDQFHPIETSPPKYSFRPARFYNQAVYSKFWPLHHGIDSVLGKHIFERHCSGIKLAPSSLLVHADRSILLRRTQEAASSSFSYSEFSNRWFHGQLKPPARNKLSERVRNELRTVLQRNGRQIVEYAYRPFVAAYAMLSEPVLQALSLSGGGGTRYRPEILKAFDSSATIGIAVSPAPKDIGGTLHRFASFCWHYPDNDLSKRGNGRIFCNQFPEYKRRRGAWNDALKINVNSALLELLRGLTNQDDAANSSCLVFYCYAVLCSEAYLDAFEGALFSATLTENWPRIPLTASKEDFLEIAKKGRMLADLEDWRKPVILSAGLEAIRNSFHGQFRLEDYEVAKQPGLIRLFDASGSKILLSGLSDAVCAFQVSGYSPISEWLKIHSWPYLRTEFTEKHLSEFLELIQRIDAQADAVKAVDDMIRSLLSGSAQLL